MSLQGALILLGDGYLGWPALVVMAVMLCLYSLWRFGEAVMGCGTDPAASTGTNFFRYRLSPVVSGGVYSAYAAYVIALLAMTRQERAAANRSARPARRSFSAARCTALNA